MNCAASRSCNDSGTSPAAFAFLSAFANAVCNAAPLARPELADRVNAHAAQSVLGGLSGGVIEKQVLDTLQCGGRGLNMLQSGGHAVRVISP
jgi:hypothetical protein